MTVSMLFNRLATPSQLQVSASQLDGVLPELEDSLKYEAAKLIQSRFYLGPDGASMLDHDLMDVIVAAIHLSSKFTDASISIKGLILTASSVSRRASNALSVSASVEECLTQQKYEQRRERVHAIEAEICRVLSYDLHVALPYAICINYMQALDVYHGVEASALTRRVFQYLNTALLSPQMIFLTHQPAAIATAAIYLGARDLAHKLPETEWWEVFDVDREELGFLVVALQSVAKYAGQEMMNRQHRHIPLTADDLKLTISAHD